MSASSKDSVCRVGYHLLPPPPVLAALVGPFYGLAC
jgi:hypothetical protein